MGWDGMRDEMELLADRRERKQRVKNILKERLYEAEVRRAKYEKKVLVEGWCGQSSEWN
jgi:uncharacterized membrane protein